MAAPDELALSHGFLVPGAVLEAVRWRATPDKYAGPREYAVRADADRYAAETLGRVTLLGAFRNPDGNSVEQDFFWREDAPDARRGDHVVATEFRLELWAGMTVPERYDDLVAAVSAAPADREVWVYQWVWLDCGGTAYDMGGRSMRIVGNRLEEVAGWASR